MTDLIRLKPDPIPKINPVPEYAATGALSEMYARTKAGLGVPWMGVVAMAFAQYTHFYKTLWTALEPVVRSQAFVEACAALRTCAEREATALAPPAIQPRLIRMGYGQAEIDNIRACNEIFSAGNMPYLLMASIARMLLEGIEWTGVPSDLKETPLAPSRPKPPLLEPHHADPSTAALYTDIKETLGLPFVNTDYRAFARWPSYFAPAWSDLKSAIEHHGYEEQLTRVHMRAMACAATLPNVTGTTVSDLRSAAERDGSVKEVLDVVRLFQWLLPGLIVNVAFLRSALQTEGHNQVS